MAANQTAVNKIHVSEKNQNKFLNQNYKRKVQKFTGAYIKKFGLLNVRK